MTVPEIDPVIDPLSSSTTVGGRGFQTRSITRAEKRRRRRTGSVFVMYTDVEEEVV